MKSIYIDLSIKKIFVWNLDDLIVLKNSSVIISEKCFWWILRKQNLYVESYINTELSSFDMNRKRKTRMSDIHFLILLSFW